MFIERGEKEGSEDVTKIYGFDKCMIEDDREKEISLEEKEEGYIKEGLDKFGCAYWYDKYHPLPNKRDNKKPRGFMQSCYCFCFVFYMFE